MSLPANAHHAAPGPSTTRTAKSPSPCATQASARFAASSRTPQQRWTSPSDVTADSKINATIKTASFDSGDVNRDGHVRGEDFFDVEQFPEISFVSNNIVATGDGYELQGDLTIKGVTRPVSLETEFNGVAVDPFGNTRAGVSAGTTISRKDFGLTWNAVLEAGGVLVSDKVAINLELAFIAPAA
jgi:polyisoprenoid-binding protein YceI